MFFLLLKTDQTIESLSPGMEQRRQLTVPRCPHHGSTELHIARPALLPVCCTRLLHYQRHECQGGAQWQHKHPQRRTPRHLELAGEGACGPRKCHLKTEKREALQLVICCRSRVSEKAATNPLPYPRESSTPPASKELNWLLRTVE